MNRLGHLHHFIVSECLNVCVNISTVVLSKNFTMEGKKSCPWHIHYFLLTIVQCSALLSFPDPYQPHCRVWMEYLKYIVHKVPYGRFACIKGLVCRQCVQCSVCIAKHLGFYFRARVAVTPVTHPVWADHHLMLDNSLTDALLPQALQNNDVMLVRRSQH